MNPNPQRDLRRFCDRELALVLAESHAAQTSPWSVPSYAFNMQHEPGTQLMGRVTLRIGQTERILLYAGHIGYSVDPAFRGHHYAERSCRLILPLARSLGMSELWITCGPDNLPSKRTLERLGAEFVQTVDVPDDYPMEPGAIRKKSRYRLGL